MRYRRAVLIYNPAARRVRQEHIERIAEEAGRHVENVATLATDAPGSATKLARQACLEGADLIIVCGGDGTINEAINGIAPGTVPLAVLPAGTANVLALELGLPRDPLRAAELLSQLEPKRISLGLLRRPGPPPESRYFLLMGGIGLDADVVYNLNLWLKACLGELAYWLAGAAEIGRRLGPFEVRVNGGRYECTFALAAQSRTYGGNLHIARHANLLAGDLEVVLFHSRSTLRYVCYLAGVLTGRLDRLRDVSFFRARQIEMRSLNGSPVRIQLDGEYAGLLPATVEIASESLTLLMPAAYIREHQRGETVDERGAAGRQPI